MSITSFDDRPGRGGFLTFNSGLPRIYLSCALPAPEKALLAWREEGYDTRFLPYEPGTQSQAEYIASLKTLSSSLSLGEHYALIAYGDAASLVLKTAQKPLAKCCAIIALYPSVLPSPKTLFPNSHQLQVHVAGRQHATTAIPRPDMCAWKLYVYENCTTGFADPSSPHHEAIESNLAWTRTLSCIRRGFGKNLDLEPLAQAHWAAKYDDTSDPDRASMAVVKNMSQDAPHVTFLPTCQGGVGRRQLASFYADFFVPSLVEDFRMRLVSRTMGVNRVVDEVVVTFTHSDEVDWMLPGVKPTGKKVEVAMVSVVAVRGEKLVSEHVYWDQASVLVQVGLLDPKTVPQMKTKKMRGAVEDLEQLPVVGGEAARLLVEPREEGYNGLLEVNGLMRRVG
ncbi:dienelactone hydrolase [Pyrenophora seminiperda CCB06]|uniref:Dienelactone hydrolase n=1 Tax=Pyrenophora seminiperda CCB06 TaxID=1302712 RepID=A0A3M7MC54_9PLEO|nr:dienelactone hydrolase [Pyrenophora seminiperda CCB06]